METLYKITEDFRTATANLQAMLDSGEIDADSVADTLEGMLGDVEDKIINVGLHLKNQKSNLEQLLEAQKSFQPRIKKVQDEIAFYEGYLFQHMTTANINEAGNELITVKLGKLPDIVNILDETKIPSKYMTIKPPVPASKAPNKKMILADLKLKVKMKFAELITDRKKLVIK